MVNALVLGGVAIVIVLLVLGAIDRWDVFGADEENPDSPTDRVQQEARREGDFDVSLLKRHKTLTLPAKVVAVSGGLLLVATGVFLYFTLKNGAPAEVPYANAVEAGAIAVAGVGGGVLYRAKKDRERGRLDILYEDDSGDEDSTETVWFAPAETTTNTDGNLIVYEHHATRILGLFGRRKLVADDRELRSERAVLSDVVAHEIPDHAIQLATDHYEIRTQEQTVTSGPSTAADYRYRSPIELPYKSYLQQRERVTKLEMRLSTMNAKLGEAQAQLHDLRRRLETQDYRGREEALEEIIDVINQLPNGQQKTEVYSDSRPERLSKAQREAAQNGSEVDA